MAHRPSLIGDGNVSDSEIGAIVAFPSAIEPVGFLYADGREVSRTIYGELFNKIGVMYGYGNNSTTFNLPDLRGQFLRGGVEFQTYSFTTTDVDIINDTISIPNHKFQHTGVKIRFVTGGGLPSPLAAGTNYFVIYVDSNTIKIATSLANAKSNIMLNLTSVGVGTNSIQQYLDPDAASRYSLQNGGNTGATFGAAQDDEFESHTHLGGVYTVVNGFAAGNPPYSGSSQTTPTQPTGGTETRPQNITVGFFIRYAAKGAIKGEALPVGTMLTFAGPTINIPNGFLLCDGSSINRDDYTDLFAAIGTSWGTATGTTFNLPDTRGLFLRGVDGLAARDPDSASRIAINSGGNIGNNVGSFQNDEFESHTHTHHTSGSLTAGAGGGAGQQGDITGATGGNETRPKNVYVNYIIRY
jgi:microcystin-dependent protein